jgi:alpha-glucoside transport system substrate-binding protein
MRKLQRSSGIRLLGAALLGAVTVLAPVACGSADDTANQVTIAGVWVGDDETTFKDVLDEFQAQSNGVHYVYQGSRALDQLLASDVRNGTEPDVVVVASPTVLSNYYHSGDLQPLNKILPNQTGQYSQQWLNLMRTTARTGGGQVQVGVALKVDLKSILWYDPATLSSVLSGRVGEQSPPSWSSVANLSGTPWCAGLGANAVSGFPGTDWIEEIMLKKFGPTVYQQWADGALSWKSPEVSSAFGIWGSILAKVRGGSASALLTNFDQAAEPMLTENPPGCYLDSQGSFITGTYENLLNQKTKANPNPKPVDHAGRNYDFFPFPAIQPANANDYEVAGNFAGMFRDTPAAEKLMTFLASKQGQQAWVDAGSYSADTQVPRSTYPDDVHRAISTILTGNDPLSFDASDLTPDALGNAFYQAVLAFTANPANQTGLNVSLAQLDQQRCQLITPTPANCPGKDATHG